MANLPALPRGRPPKLKDLIDCLKSADAATLNEVRAVMREPVSGEWLVGRITTLRRHYSASLPDDRHDEAMMEDWLDALETFPRFAVEAACADYLRSETFPPRPADICQRAAAVMGDLRKRLAEVSAPREAPPLEISPEERARRASVLSNLHRELQSKARDGFGSVS
jgi:hypothetical protein